MTETSNQSSSETCQLITNYHFFATVLLLFCLVPRKLKVKGKLSFKYWFSYKNFSLVLQINQSWFLRTGQLSSDIRVTGFLLEMIWCQDPSDLSSYTFTTPKRETVPRSTVLISQIALDHWGEGAPKPLLFSSIIPTILDVWNELGISPGSLSDRQSKDYDLYFLDHQYLY